MMINVKHPPSLKDTLRRNGTVVSRQKDKCH